LRYRALNKHNASIIASVLTVRGEVYQVERFARPPPALGDGEPLRNDGSSSFCSAVKISIGA
jgi:hypothetical protein